MHECFKVLLNLWDTSKFVLKSNKCIHCLDSPCVYLTLKIQNLNVKKGLNPRRGSPEHVARPLGVLITDVGVEPAVPVGLVRHQSLPAVRLHQLVEPNLVVVEEGE